MQEMSTRLAHNVGEIVRRIDTLPHDAGRSLIAIAGAPGSGTSTVAQAVVSALVARGDDAVLVPLDGFHLDDRLLEPRGLLPRKGAPETFDFGGFLSTIGRVRTEPTVVIPVFDRSREIAIAGADEIAPETRIVIVEGNYLCLDEDPWRALAPLWDLSVYLDVPVATLKLRLVERWLSHGFDRQAAEAKAQGNDIRNAERVHGAVLPTDLKLKN